MEDFGAKPRFLAGIGFKGSKLFSAMKATSSISMRRVVVLLLVVLAFLNGTGCNPMESSSSITTTHPRKLLAQDSAAGTNRISEGCNKDDIIVIQGATSPLPNGIPTYTVQVLNLCSGVDSECAISGIHLSCGWFSSARLINPRVFRRLRYNDCLVNDGRALMPGSSVSFQYANSFPYPLSVSCASCA